jgi:hypothetical protein
MQNLIKYIKRRSKKYEYSLIILGKFCLVYIDNFTLQADAASFNNFRGCIKFKKWAFNAKTMVYNDTIIYNKIVNRIIYIFETYLKGIECIHGKMVVERRTKKLK